MYFLQKIVVTLILLFIFGISLYFFATGIIKKSVPKHSLQQHTIESISDSIQVFRNDFWIPHIIAKNEDDLFYAIGYVHAQDRLWQMDFTRRVVKGELSELFGKHTVAVDQFMRAIAINEIAESFLKKSGKKTISIFESYCKGINDYILIHKNRLSFEFGALDYIPNDFTILDCIAIGKGMALELSLPFWSELALGEIANRIGYEKAMTLIPSYLNSDPHIFDDTVRIGTSINRKYTALENYNYYHLFDGLSEKIDFIKNTIGILGSGVGSNSWAINKDKLIKSSAIIANDPHLTLSLPSRWYQMHATAPGFNAAGLTIPGIPLFIIGRNDNIGWGITNIMTDDCDFFIELIDSNNPDYYYDAKKGKLKFEYVPDTIKIKGEQELIYYKRKTVRSYVISDFHLYNYPELSLDLKYHNFKNQYLNKYCLTFLWTNFHIKDEFLAIYRMNKANNWNEFVKAVSLWGSPGQNFTYADKKGNIGIYPATVIPIREANCNPVIPNPAWLPGTSWQGFKEPGALGYIYNPQKKWVASANNKTNRKSDGYITSYWEPSSRAVRMNELLSQVKTFNARDAQIMQYDLFTPYAQSMMYKCNPILLNAKVLMNEIEEKAFNLLKKWDYLMTEDSPAAALYNSFLEKLIFNTFHDELGDRLYRKYTIISNISFRRIMELLDESHNPWYDLKYTDEDENRDYIVFKSFRDAVSELLEIYNTNNIYEWKWGKIHTLTLSHPFSRSGFMNPTVTLGPIEMSGNLTTLNNSEWRIFKPFDVVVGASARFIADMEDSVIYMNIPGGASGDPLSPHYGDQLQLWLRGGYVDINISPLPDKDFRLSVILLPYQ